MALRNLLEATAEFYVGLSKEAEIVEVYPDLTHAILLQQMDERVVSLGRLTVTVIDYEEIFRIGTGLEHDPASCEACDS